MLPHWAGGQLASSDEGNQFYLTVPTQERPQDVSAEQKTRMLHSSSNRPGLASMSAPTG